MHDVYHYRMHGLIVRSELPLIGLSDIGIQESCDLTIRVGEVPETLEEPIVDIPDLKINSDALLMRWDDVGLFFVTRSGEVTVSPGPDGTRESLSVILMGRVFGAYAHLNDIFIMHSSAMVKDDRCILVAGDSGNGKSTTCAHLVKKGFQLLTEEMCRISFDDNGTPLAYPGPAGIKLWEDSLVGLGENPDDHRPVRPGFKKYWIPLRDRHYPNIMPIEAVFVLEAHEDKPFNMQELKGMQVAAELERQGYTNLVHSCLGNRASRFRNLVAMAAHCRVIKVDWPKRAGDRVDIAGAIIKMFHATG